MLKSIHCVVHSIFHSHIATSGEISIPQNRSGFLNVIKKSFWKLQSNNLFLELQLEGRNHVSSWAIAYLDENRPNKQKMPKNFFFVKIQE